MSQQVQPSIDTLKKIIDPTPPTPAPPTHQMCTPCTIVQIERPDRTPSFLFESSVKGDTVDRYSFIGIQPTKIIKTGDDATKYPEGSATLTRSVC
ncbi:hypothetical protein Cantr_08933 [Candida viswanathii]|uniref:Anthranilate synthase component I N-terminal domain-containing protein n=1 Tax=Candida viswanathii TaxID=5486 RepID=A0A367YA18_9ASCO|nr:hypothetical protein Cantr_08933 [Candida viswanathii]